MRCQSSETGRHDLDGNQLHSTHQVGKGQEHHVVVLEHLLLALDHRQPIGPARGGQHRRALLRVQLDAQLAVSAGGQSGPQVLAAFVALQPVEPGRHGQWHRHLISAAEGLPGMPIQGLPATSPKARGLPG